MRLRPSMLIAACTCAFVVGCGLLPEDFGLDPTGGLPSFATPDQYTVRAGDTLAKIAARHRVTVAELKSWNGLSGDIIEIDQVLVIWKSNVARAPATASRAPSGGRVGGRPSTPQMIPMVAVTEVDVSGERVVIETPTPAGVLGVEIGGTDMEDLARRAEGITRRDNALGEDTRLGSRSGALGGPGSAESVDLPGPLAKRPTGPTVGSGPVRAPSLGKPAPKKCLPPPTDVQGEAGLASNVGLTVAQINKGMGPISQHAVACFPDGTTGIHNVTVEMVVGCNGQVTSTSLIASNGIPAPVSACLQQTLGYAGFPAHAVPDGIVFHSPLRFSF